jgi:hypothetical protein
VATSKPSVSEAAIHLEIETVSDAQGVILHDLIDAEHAEVVKRFGEDDSEENDLPGGTKTIFPSRRVDEITRITEDGVVLADDDFEVRQKGWAVRRLDTGTHPATTWGEDIHIEFTPVDDTARRKRVILDILKIAKKYGPYQSERLGDYSYMRQAGNGSKDYQSEREALLSSLSSEDRLFA